MPITSKGQSYTKGKGKLAIIEYKGYSGETIYKEIAKESNYSENISHSVSKTVKFGKSPFQNFNTFPEIDIRMDSVCFIPYPDTNAGTYPVCLTHNPVNNLYYIGGYGNRVLALNPNTFEIDKAIKTGWNMVGSTWIFPILNLIYANSINNKIYVANLRDGTVSVVDGATNEIISTIPVGDDPIYLACNLENNKIYVVNYGYPGISSVSIIDSNADTLITTINLTQLQRSALWVPNFNKVYIAGGGPAGKVTVLDGNTNMILKVIDGIGFSPVGIAYNSVNQKIYVTNYQSNTVSVIDVTLDSLITKINVGEGPINIIHNPLDNKIYTANFDGNSVTVISGENDSVEATITVGIRPYGLLYEPYANFIYVTDLWSDSLFIIDGNSNNIVGTLPSGGDLPLKLTCNPFQNQIIVGNLFGGNVRIFDIMNNNILATIQVGGPVRWLKYNPTNGLLYAGITTFSETNIIMVIDPETNTIVAKMPTSNSREISGMCVNPNDNKLYVASDSIEIFDLTTHTKITEIHTGINPRGIVYNSCNNCIYVSHILDEKITAIDGTSNGIVTDIKLPSGGNNLCVNTINNKVYVSLFSIDTVAVIDGLTNSIIGCIRAGDQPGRMVFNSQRDKVYVANYLSDNVTIIDGEGDSLIANVSVGDDPVAFDYNAILDKIYVANGFDSTVSVINGFSDSLETTIVLGGEYPLAIVSGQEVNRVFALIADVDDEINLAVIDALEDTLVKLVPLNLIRADLVGIYPYDMIWDPINQKVFAPAFWHSRFVSFSNLTSIEEEDVHEPKIANIRTEFHPNPFTTVTYLKVLGPGKNGIDDLDIYDASGRLVKSIKLETNTYELGADLVPGVYFLKLKVGEYTETKKLIKIR